MTARRSRHIAGAAFLALAGTAAAQVTITDLGNPFAPGEVTRYPTSYPQAISENGQVAGVASGFTDDWQRISFGWVWDSVDGLTQLDNPDIDCSSISVDIRDINSAGHVAGFIFGSGCTSGYVQVAIVWEDGIPRILPPLDPSIENRSVALSINDAGAITGWATNAAGEQVAVLWSPDGSVTEIGPERPAWATYSMRSEGFQIDAHGRVAVIDEAYSYDSQYSESIYAYGVNRWYYDTYYGESNVRIWDGGLGTRMDTWGPQTSVYQYDYCYYGYFYDPGYGYSRYGYICDYSVYTQTTEYLSVMGMNDHGQLVGSASEPDYGSSYPVRWDIETGAITQITDPSMTIQSVVEINNGGTMIGSTYDYSTYSSQPIVSLGGQWMRLHALLPSGSGNWQLKEAIHLNDANQVVGYGYNFDAGEDRAFLVDLGPTNEPPVCYDNNVVVNIGDSVNLVVESTDADLEDMLSLNANDPLPGNSTLAADGTFTWDATTIDDVGVHVIGVTVTDSAGATGTCTLQITVVNRPPTCSLEVDGELYEDDTTPGTHGPSEHDVIVTDGDTIVAIFTGADADPGDVLTFGNGTLPAGSSLTDVTDGVRFEWTPTADDVAANPHVITVAIEDSLGGVAVCILQVTVNERPEAFAVAGPTYGEGPTGVEIELACDSFLGREVTLDASSSVDGDGDELGFQWDVAGVDLSTDESGAIATGMFPIGVSMVTVTVTDGRGGVDTADVLVTVVDGMPPQVSVTTDVAALWPPKGDMRDVTIMIVATDNCTDPDQVLALQVAIRSDEPDDHKGNGEKTGDVNGADGFADTVDLVSSLTYDTDGDQWIGSVPLQLRAERDGRGDGRAYTIVVTVFDANGNFTECTCVVVVPHDRRKGR